MSEKQEPLLKMTGLRLEGQADEKWIGIVHGIDLTLERGEIMGLIGESGAGKSTIGLAAMGYARGGCRISGGEIIFDGINMRTASDKQLREIRGARIAYVAQSAAASFNPAHRLIDQFAEAAVQHGIKTTAEAHADAIELYRVLDLPDPENIGKRYPHQVSGGQLQRAMVAMAMACRPDLIVFDEPTTALDVTTQIEVLAAIKDIVKHYNTAALYITHDLAVVSQVSDRIMVLRMGNMIELGDAREMIANPKEEYTRELLSVRSFQKPLTPVADVDKPMLTIEGVNAYYGDFHVLKDITVDVHRGKTMAVVGESGSGKSTMARVITGLLPPRNRVSYL